MAREVQKDFAELCGYIGNYEMKNVISNPGYYTFVSVCQKRYYSYLTLLAELHKYIDVSLPGIQYQFLQESCSDCGLSLFDALHGNYKGAKFLLRSSIENFLKGYMYDTIPSIIREKNVFSLFDTVRENPPFTEDSIFPLYNRIHDIYKELCAVVHTATKLQMSSMTAFSVFPDYKKIEADYYSTRLLKLINSYVSLIAMKYNKEFHAIHFSNKAIINISLLNQYKKKIQNIE